MKKLISVLLSVIMITAMFLGAGIVRADSAVAGNFIEDESCFVNNGSEPVLFWRGWFVTSKSPKLTKIGYKYNSDPIVWLVNSISDTSEPNEASHTYTPFENDVYMDDELHGAIATYGMNGGLAEYNAYRAHLYIDVDPAWFAERANASSESIIIVGEFENGEVLNLLVNGGGEQAVRPTAPATANVYVKGVLYEQPINNYSNLTVAKTKNDMLTNTAEADGSSYIDVTLPDIAVASGMVLNIRIKVAKSSGKVNESSVILTGKDPGSDTVYTGSIAPGYTMDNAWYIISYDLSDFSTDMSGKVLTNLRIPCAKKSGKAVNIDFISFDTADGSHEYAASYPAPTLNESAITSVTVNNTAVDAAEPVRVKAGEAAILDAAGYAKVDGGYIKKFGYSIDDGDIVAVERRFVDTATYNTVTKTDDTKGFAIPGIDLSGLSTGKHVVRFFAKATDQSNKEINEDADIMASLELEQIVVIAYKELKFSAVNVSIKAGGKMDVNFKADKSLFSTGEFEDPYVTFNGSTDPVYGTEVGDNLVFTFADIEPDHMKDNITATLHATHDGDEYTAQLSYSIVDYCKDAYATNQANTSLMHLLADMLNYGAMAQKYSDPTVDDGELVTADGGLGGLLSGYAATTDPILTESQTSPVTPIANGTKKVKWTNVGLRLDDEVSIRLKFSKLDGFETCAPDSVKFTIAGSTEEYTAEVTDKGNGSFVSYLKVPVNKMRALVSAVVYEGDAPVSNTISYSVEFYAAAKQNDTDANLAALVKAMMKYGDSAAAFAG